MKRSSLFLAVVLALAVSLPVFAQSDRGTITGSVTDPNGAVIPNAKIVATSATTGERREGTSTDTGSFTLPQVKADVYNITVEAPGFKLATLNGVQVGVQITRSVNVTMQVGATSESIDVTAEAPVIQTESPVLQTNVTERQVRELPLLVQAESGGRTPLAFIFLDSNVSSGNSQSSTNFRVNGGQGLGTEILIDGSATRRAQNGTFFSEVAPGPNAFQEFTLSSGSFSAEYGNTSGGVVNFTLKSGTSDYHGEAYNFFRNEALNANTFARNFRDERKDQDRQNNFGGNVGGPLPFLPRDRAFFFGNYEGYRQSRSESVFISVPTVRMRSGDFSELLTDPYVTAFAGGPIQIFDPNAPRGSRTAIPGNRIDLYNGGSIIDPVGLAIARSFPEPTRAGVYRNYLAESTTPNDVNNYVGKLDFVLTQKQRLSTSYSYRKQETIKALDGQPAFTRFPEPYVASRRWDQSFRSHFARLQHDYTISSNVLNHLNLGFTRFEVANHNFTEGLSTDAFGLPPDATQNKAFPLVSFPGYGDAVLDPDPRSYEGIGSTFFSDNLGDNGVQASDFVTWVTGGHTFKFGADLRWQQFNVHQLIHPGGEFNFRHDQTTNSGGCCPKNEGWPIASLITGATEFSFNSLQTIDPGWRQFSSSFFVNDDWKITPKLTVNLGLRYDLPGLRTEARDRFRSFDPTVTNPVTGTRGALVGAGGQGGLQAEHETLSEPDHSNWGPRFGFAYGLSNRTVIRGGIGVYYAPVLYGVGGNGTLTEGTQGYSTSQTGINGGGDAAPDLFLRNYRSLVPADPNGQFIGNDVDFFDANFRTGRTVQYSLDVQQELPWNFALQVGYIGNRGTRLRSDFGRLNALPLNALRLGFPLLDKPLSAVTAADRAYATSAGVTLPANNAAVFPTFTGNVAQSLRQFPQYGFIRNQLESQGRSWYDALNLRLNRRFTQGIQFGASYTWAKLITNASEDILGGSPIGGVVQNPYDISSLRSVSSSNPAHALALNYLIELPFGKGRPFLNDGPLSIILGGWQVGAIHRYQQGTPLVIRTSRDRGFLDIFGVRGDLRPNITGPISLSDEDPTELNASYLNASGFSNPPSYFGPGPNFGPADVGSAAYAAYYADPLRFFGNAPPTLSGLRGPGFLSENLSILKKTPITERFNLELRGEFINAFNRHRYNFVGNDFNASNFGSIGIDDPGYGARVVQLGARIIF